MYYDHPLGVTGFLDSMAFRGAGDGTRTHDILLGNSTQQIPGFPRPSPATSEDPQLSLKNQGKLSCHPLSW